MEFEEEDHEEEEEDEDEEMAVTPTFNITNKTTTGAAQTTTHRYKECLKNHAVAIGGHAVDGCGEFMQGGVEGTLEALKCAACNCHRNFHRKELLSPHFHHHHPQVIYNFTPYNRTSPANPSGFLHVRPLALTSPSGDLTTVVTSSSGRKRFRTKFTSEQKEKLHGFAEKVGWKVQKEDEVFVEEFCQEMGIQRHVLKVWLHNNKHTIGKKP